MCNSVFIVGQSDFIGCLFQGITGISHGNAPTGKSDHLQVVFCVPKGDDFFGRDVEKFTCTAQALCFIETLWHGFDVKRGGPYEDQIIFKWFADFWEYVQKLFRP